MVYLLKVLSDKVKQLLLGNAVILKISYDHTRSIYVMHSNERGECCLRTLVDRSGSVDTT